MNNAELKERLTDTLALLSVPGVGRVRYHRLVERFGSPAAVLSAHPDDLASVPGVSDSTARAIADVQRSAAAPAAVEVIRRGWDVLFPDSPEYPAPLAGIPDAPAVLFRRGRAWHPEDRMVAMVGTRHPTEQGRRFATGLAREMAGAGLIVVSGMAEGIDSCAHRGALQGGGVTVAVWGRPLDEVYPQVNRGLAEEIVAAGAVYSEYPPGTPYSPASFPDRNRIISGLCDAVIIVEAGEKSGALITAAYALEQGRELFAVPGPPAAPRSAGTNNLIKQGANLLTGLDDLFSQLPRLKGAMAASRHTETVTMTDSERRLVQLLAEGPMQIDQLARTAVLDIAAAMELLLALELKGVVREIAGKRYALCE